MDRDKFNQDMGSYIRKRRERQKGKGNIKINIVKGDDEPKKREKIPDVAPDEIAVFDARPNEEMGFLDKILSFFVSGYEEVEEEEPREELTPAEMKKLARMQDSKVKVDEVDMEDPDIEELDVPKPTFFGKLFSFLGFGERAVEEEEFRDLDDFDPDEYAVEEANRVMFEEDVKNIIKIAHKWIDELPPKKKKEFKESDDFQEYRKLLDKLGLLKK